MNQTLGGVAAAWMAARGAKGRCKPVVNDRWRRLLASELDAGFMGLEGCTDMGFGGKAQPLWGCPLTPQTTHGGTGVAHGPWEKPRGGIGVSPDIKTNPGRYWGRPRAPGENLWGYRGVP